MGVRSPRRKRHSQSPRRRTVSNDSNDNDGDSDEYEDLLVSPPDVPQSAQTYEKDKHSSFPEKPLPLITFNQESNTLAMDPEALACIANIAHPIAIVAIAGLYRTGKSSLLNWLLSPSEIFPVASTIERCTHGIWLYPSPFMWTTSKQETVAVLFLDTEGLGGLKASQEYDLKIFSLTALLSSKLIYNSQGSIDEKAIHGLSFIANIAKHIRLDTKESGSDSDEMMRLHSLFPSFLWLVRDFALELVDEDGDPISSSEYLEQALAEQMPRVPSNVERNRLRAMMKEFFRERDCMTLVRPVLDEEELQRSDLSLQSLRPEFQVQIEQLRKLVFDEKTLKPKSIQERVMNGSMFVGLVQAYVDSINRGSVPVISSAWQSIAESESRKARENAMEMYRAAVSTLVVPVEPNVLNQTLNEVERKCLVMFKKQSMGEFAEKMKRELQQYFASERMKMIDRNEKACRERCQLLLQKLYSDVVQPFLIDFSGSSPFSEDCGSDFECFDKEWTQFRDTYLAQAVGSAKLECLMSFSESKYSEALRIIVTRREENFEKKIRLLETDIANVKEQLGSVSAREEIYQEEMEKIQSVSSEILSEKARLEAENQENQSQMARLESKLASYQFNRQETEVSKEAADLQFDFLTKRHKEVDTELAVMKSQYERVIKEKEAQAQKLNELTQESENVASIKTCACVLS
uniref:Guanylatebinding protein putative n=1 Tax=Albugo laibachii Nc14 TaxID=890382 RepID=F0WFV1_9STRA|nr:guanylatebinding protein putative [Albugo laibachii Nc14]|eukprot:CCA20085.1 guanylatebinding protein putative [Albugo laibachii Nc14]